MSLSLTQFYQGPLSAVSSAAISPYRALTITSNAVDSLTVAHAGTASTVVGFSTQEATATGFSMGVAIAGHIMVEVNAASTNIAPNDYLKVGTSAGILVKASAGDSICAMALEPASTDGAKIRAIAFIDGQQAVSNAGKTVSGSSGTLTQAEIDGRSYTLICSNNGTVSQTLPAAASVAAGTMLTVIKTGTAGAITLTPDSGNINGGASYNALDAQNDRATFVPIGTNWFILYSVIA